MRAKSLSTLFGLLAMCVVGLTGCGKSKTSAPTDVISPAADAHPHSHDHGHGHAHGPHEGHLIELGTEDYHAELTQNEASQSVGIYLLGADATTAAPTEAASVTIHVSVDGQPTQYTLPAVAAPDAVAQSDESAGKASYFELASEPLLAIVSGASQSPHTRARISITIDGLPYSGTIDTEQPDHTHAAEHSHSHASDDILVWRKKISEQGYDIALGHHGTSLLAGGNVEPAVQVTREGQPVADAKVFNVLLAEDGRTVLAEEVATVYEPPTSDEPSHYAQGALKIPAGTRQAIIRYRIALPEGKGERTFDVPVAVR